jgi:hypothetical protein
MVINVLKNTLPTSGEKIERKRVNMYKKGENNGKGCLMNKYRDIAWGGNILR